MKNEFYYPLPEEIFQVLYDLCPAGFTAELAQNIGIFIDFGQHKDYSEFLSSIYWDYETILNIHFFALQTTGKQSLSGFWVTVDGDNSTDLSQFSMLNLITENVGKPIGKEKLSIKNPILTQNSSEEFYGEVDYKQKRKGRLLFLEEVDRCFKYHCKKTSDGQFQFLIDVDTSSDKNIFENWLIKEIKNKNPEFYCNSNNIDADDLPTYKLVDFFDQLANKGVRDWNFKEIVKIIVKQQENENDDSGDIEEVQEKQLVGITKAILEGTSLRNNSFVKQCEDDGYRFMAMTYRYVHKHDAKEIIISAEFKERPKVFEINMDKFSKIQGIEMNAVQESINPSVRKSLLHEFYQQAKRIFDELSDGISTSIAN